ncbi:MAG: RodZ domain-containing protein [Candidatus Omnitrophota bacterium]
MTEIKSGKGEFLKRTRESRGISLTAVHEATKIPMDALRAIEEGYTVRTLSSFYYKGFLKMYAQYLGLDVRQVIDDYKKEELPGKINGRVNSDEFSEAVNMFFSSETRKLILKILVIIVCLFIFFKAAGFVRDIFSPKGKKAKVVRPAQTKNEDPAKGAPKVPPPENKKTVVSAPVATKTIEKKAEAKAKAEKNVSLTVMAKNNTWLQVKSDGVVVFQSTLQKGFPETWTADEKVELSGKNISELEFELNGKMIGSLGRSDRGARKLVVTKDGLSVKK